VASSDSLTSLYENQVMNYENQVMNYENQVMKIKHTKNQSPNK